MLRLLPYRFKRIGKILLISGVLLWITMQVGWIEKLVPVTWNFHLLNVVSANGGFFSFLIGLYFLAFSKEATEDEMIAKIRFGSFQFAGLLQIVFIIAGFLCFAIAGEPDADRMLVFFILNLLVFWIGFLSIYNIQLKRAGKE